VLAVGAVALLAACRPVPPPPPPPPAGIIHTGFSFDACTAPATSTMSAWRGPSGFGAVGVYIGGANRGCSQPNLKASWVSTVFSQGWRLLPLYVGLQAPCNPAPLAKIDPTSATSQGILAAEDAIANARALGIRTGSPIYLDMEAYPHPNAACTVAVQDFVHGWSTRLRGLGYMSGFYSSADSGIADMNAMVALGLAYPDEIWFARWNGIATLFGEPSLNDAYWANHQRHHQYLGGHQETWGGVTINIDTTYSDGAVAGP
jgi:Domain of unknown function (DUF1906)